LNAVTFDKTPWKGGDWARGDVAGPQMGAGLVKLGAGSVGRDWKHCGISA
jgi:hypothetical protein